MFYQIDFTCDDHDSLQSKLNDLYNYQEIISTKVFHRNRINLFYTLMTKLIAQNVLESFDSALDIGSSAGVYSKIISDFGFKTVWGIDVDANGVDIARQHFAFKENSQSLEYKVMRAEDLDVDKKYNFILCTEVIEHTDNPTQVVEIIKEILAPKGVAIISLPNKISIPWYSLYLFYKMTNKPMDPSLKEHLNYPFYKSIKLFQDKNIKVIETSGTNLILGGRLLRWLYKTPFFAFINWLNFSLSRIWPLKYFTQFFFIVLKKEVDP